LLIVDPSSQELGLPAIPVRFIPGCPGRTGSPLGPLDQGGRWQPRRKFDHVDVSTGIADFGPGPSTFKWTTATSRAADQRLAQRHRRHPTADSAQFARIPDSDRRFP